jgi:hypothetical protein
MASYYYSGQGKLMVASKNATTGEPEGFDELGNCPSMEISIEVTKFEHKESESGSRAVDLTIVQEKKGTFTMNLESLTLSNLALGFWGNNAAVIGASITDEQIPLWHDKWMPLAHPKVSTVVVGDDAIPTTTYVLDTDYELNAAHGAIRALSGGAITDGQVCFIDYDHAAYGNMDALTVTSQERWIRFEGLNTIDNKEVIIDIYKASLDPLTGFGVLNEEIGAIEISGNILLDSTRAQSSQFFRQRYVT